MQAVLSCTMIHGGEVNNVIPDSVTIAGTIRDLKPAVYTTITERCAPSLPALNTHCSKMSTSPLLPTPASMQAVVAGQAASWGAKATVTLKPAYPCVENHVSPRHTHQPFPHPLLVSPLTLPSTLSLHLPTHTCRRSRPMQWWLWARSTLGSSPKRGCP